MAIRPHCPPEDEDVGDSVLIVGFTGQQVSLNEETTDHIREHLLALAELAGPARLLLDFGNVDYISSLGLGLLVFLNKQLRAAGRHLTIVNLSEQVYEVFVVTSLDRILDLRRGSEPEQQQVRWSEIPRG
jgi:anti-anti-sigma factor